MKKLFTILAILAIAGIAQAATVQVTWNPNTEPDLAGYKLYHGTASGQYGPRVLVPSTI